MFYAQFVLAKKGPLARIWLAAHWDKKLTKAHVFETNIEKSVDGILQPKVKMALRTSGHLLLGVVRIYSRKAKYLLADCNEAFVKIKMAFRPGMVDLPEDNREAAVNAITLPEVFHDFESTMPELNDVDIEAQFSLNQSRAEEITMREEYGHAPLDQEDGFDLQFDEEASELIRQPYDQDANILFEDHTPLSKVCDAPQYMSSASSMMGRIELEPDSFAGNLNTGDAQQLFELKLFDDTADPPMVGVDINEPPRPPSVPAPAPESDDDDHFGGPPSPMGHPSSDDGSRPGTPAVPVEEQLEAQSIMPPPAPVVEPQEDDVPPLIEEERVVTPPPPPPEQQDQQDHTQLLQNEEESFALAPVDASVVRGFTKTKRKRKLIVDEVKNISGEEMKAQLSDTSDIVITLDLAPPTKRLMHWKESGGVEKLFALPGRTIPARALFKMYQRHLTSRAAPNEDQNRGDENEQAAMEQEQQQPEMAPPAQTESSTRKGRKRKTLEPIEENIQQEAIELAQPMSVPPPIQEEPFLKPSEISAPPMTPLAQPMTPLAQPMTPLAQPMTPLAAPMTPLAQPMTPMAQPMSVGPVELSLPPASPYRTGAPPTPLHELNLPHEDIVQQNNITDQGPSFADVSAAPFTPQPSLIMENMGYVQQDNLEPQLHEPHPDPSMMANMGYDEQHPPATTPGALSERGQPTPYHEDYEMPVSVGPQEEQATDETFEQFEERVLNKRAAHMYRLVKSRMERTDNLHLSDLTYRNNKKQAAQKFYSMLVLKKFKVLNISQEVSYGDISIMKGPNFDNPTL